MFLHTLASPRFGQVILSKPQEWKNTYVFKLTDKDATSADAQNLGATKMRDGSAEVTVYFHNRTDYPGCGGGPYSCIQFDEPHATHIMKNRSPEDALEGAYTPTSLGALISLLAKSKSASPSKLYDDLRVGLNSFMSRLVREAATESTRRQVFTQALQARLAELK